MKKALFVLALLMTASTVAFAATTKEAAKSFGEKWHNFWSREGERQGYSGNQSSVNGALQKMNPFTFFKDQEQAYNDRKAQGLTK
jgi:Spy/CpxP family protein refolding chaperone